MNQPFLHKLSFINMEKVLTIVLKTVERCNINCTYCYFFNGPDKGYKERPPYISFERVQKLTQFLQQGCKELNITKVRIGIHGEPLMQKKHEFDQMCNHFKSNLEPEVKVVLTVQTNGMLIDEEWLELIQKYKVGLGISIDGPKEYHDKYRVDHYGKGTYDRVVNKIKLIMDSPLKDKVGALSVINPDHNARVIYRHFVDELGFKNMNFLLQDYNYNNVPPYDPKLCGYLLCDIFDEWIKDNNPKINISYFSSLFNLFNDQHSFIYGVGAQQNDKLPIITIATNGGLSPVDELRSTNTSFMNSTNIDNTTLKEFLNWECFQILQNAFSNSPSKCKTCCWENICKGGGIVNRFKSENGFNNPSIYCEGLREVYATVAAFILKNGYPLNKIEDRLFN
jgi:uncharacterized protein